MYTHTRALVNFPIEAVADLAFPSACVSWGTREKVTNSIFLFVPTSTNLVLGEILGERRRQRNYQNKWSSTHSCIAYHSTSHNYSYLSLCLYETVQCSLTFGTHSWQLFPSFPQTPSQSSPGMDLGGQWNGLPVHLSILKGTPYPHFQESQSPTCLWDH